jgi:hypothetical protein
MPRYRMLDTIDWEALNGRQVRLEVSPSYVMVVTREGQLVTLAQVVRPRRAETPPREKKPTRLQAAEEG